MNYNLGIGPSCPLLLTVIFKKSQTLSLGIECHFQDRDSCKSMVLLYSRDIRNIQTHTSALEPSHSELYSGYGAKLFHVA